MLLFACIGIFISFSNEIIQFAVLRLVGEGFYLEAFSKSQISSLVVLFSHIHNQGIQVADISGGLIIISIL
ncbi:hypothetical protein SAMN02745866_02998 [Alteromonadaceae bacterium Bs31]|nr:hypothetical protein SAMN02745866_02998 [Alteromonadaceae bacterium Bs31]